MRYVGQNYELQVAVPFGEISQSDFTELKTKFFKEHEKNYGYFNPTAPVQFVNFRSEATGMVAKPNLATIDKMTDDIEKALIETRKVYFAETGTIDCPVYDRYKLGQIDRVEGPCIIEQMDSTSVIPPNTHFKVDCYGNIIVAV